MGNSHTPYEETVAPSPVRRGHAFESLVFCVLAGALVILPFLRGGVDASGTFIVAVAGGIALIAMGAMIFSSGRIQTPNTRSHFWLLGLVVLLVVSWIWSVDRGFTLRSLVRTLPILGAYAVVVMMPRQGIPLRAIGDGLAMLGVLLAATLAASTQWTSIKSILPVNPNHLGIMMAALASVGIASAVVRRRHHIPSRMATILRASAGLATASGVFATGSRGALIALGAGLAAPALIRRRRNPSILLVAGLAVGLLVGVAYAVGIAPTSAVIRVDVWKAAFATALERPLFGFGWGTFPLLGNNLPLMKWTTGTAHAHSTPVELMVENGAIGCLFALIGCLGVVRFILRRSKRHIPQEVIPLIACASALVVPTLFEFHLSLPAPALLLAMTAGCAVMGIALHDPRRMRTLRFGVVARPLAAGVVAFAGLGFFALGVMDQLASQNVRQAVAAAREGQLEESLEHLEDARRWSLRPSEIEAAIGRTLLAQRRFGTGNRIEDAIAAFERAVEDSPLDAGAWADLSSARRLVGDAEGRAEALARAAAIDGPSRVGRWADLASARVAIGDIDGAVAACRYVSETRGRLASECLSAFLMAGGPRESLGQMVASSAADWTRLARFLQAGGASDHDVLRTLERALEIKPGYADAALLAFRITRRSIGRDPALEVLASARRAGSNNTELLITLAEGRLSQGRIEKARFIADEILAKRPRLEAAHRIIGKAIARTHGFAAEAEYWEAQAEARPGWVLPLEQAARAWRAAGQMERAQSAAARALGEEPPAVASPPPLRAQ